jgi:hypothetical protein
MAKSTVSTFADSYFDTIIEQHMCVFPKEPNEKQFVKKN